MLELAVKLCLDEQEMWMCVWLHSKWKMSFCSMDTIRLLFTAHWFSISLAKDTNSAEAAT